MKNIIWLFFFAIVFLNYSCIKEVDLDFKQIDKQVVVNCLFCPDSLFNVHLSFSANPLDTNTEIIENAKIELWSGFAKIDDLKYVGNGDYLSNVVANIETPYTIKIDVPEYEIIYATDTIPSKSDYNYVNNTAYCKEIESYLYSTLDFNIADKIGSDYYNLSFPYTRSGYIDSNFITSFCWFQAESNVISNETNNMIGNFYTNVIFSDSFFQNETQSFSIDYETDKIFLPHAYSETIDTNLIVILQLNKISFANYKYKKSVIQAEIINTLPDLYNTNQDFYIYSNITNGLGIFAGFNPIYDTLIYEGENYH
ncbi:MAG: DUF4249 family protein [Bacteroidales bacterium]|nr:DUF4249 family protein [Bacteroidales bacterium]